MDPREKPAVLVVNDNEASLSAVSALLDGAAKRQAFTIMTANSGEQALRRLLVRDFAVILLDVNMPGLDGFETARLIHGRPRSAATPIIFLTAHRSDEFDRIKGYEAGAADYLFTPLVPQVLQAKVSVFVELFRKRHELERKAASLAELNRELQVQRLEDLERANAALQAEVTERRAAEQRAHELAIRDTLTGLFNRRSLNERLEHAIATAERQKGRLALLFLDLDRFKYVNDSLGHDKGDELLKQVAARLRAVVRESDSVARLGGDEFVVLLENLHDLEDVAEVATKICTALANPFQLARSTVKVSASVGVGVFPEDGANASVLMKNADLAMYEAKHQGRNGHQFYREELNRRLLERIRHERELQLALENDEFELHYQPKVDVARGTIAGVEALLRWRHPQLGLLSADHFMSLAEEAGMLVPLSEWALRAACRQARDWRDAGWLGEPVRIAVNVAEPQVYSALPDTLGRLLDECDLSPAHLELEITETLLMRDVDRAATVLAEIGETGVSIAVDDFGTGYSSLAMLKALPIHILKIDQSFVRDLPFDRDTHAIVTAIVQMAHAIGLKVIAEGVEGEAQLETLRALGCDEYQGYLFSKPLPANELAERFRTAAGASAARPGKWLRASARHEKQKLVVGADRPARRTVKQC
ncbi:MAG: EAL domain-containing protein [Aromatoleum sp.]|jgi:diguanylate cyclase (GGDEF)-like protein|uniref:putative bifunctional diguanylate cyclase/phosphodiesterase n=1 Tax=Aromatoleum sp. TaxID=2307007 RepID=UPI002894B88A|nr:EAL domain-containing protein [Aromatoleum sp.]MDT3672389.1 EAL domain-containing protein [Aromatoleum sp.]